MTSMTKKWLRDLLIPLDFWRYILWRRFRSKRQIIVKSRYGEKIILRSSPTTDLSTAFEIFVNQAYQKPTQIPRILPQFIVDVGANVGYSVIYFAHTYPNARLLVFEPHPVHLAKLYQHLELNGLLNRVWVVSSAVSNCNTKSFLTDNENESTVVEQYRADRLAIQVRDFFTEVGEHTIDLLKMDIEGGEYPILQDKRFETLNIRMIVLEWHNTEKVCNGRQWCSDRLTSLGYRIMDGHLIYGKVGILWAWKDEYNYSIN